MFCGKCGRENPDKSRICRYCGAELKGFYQNMQQNRQTAPEKSNRQMLWIVIISVIAVVAVVLLILSFIKEPSTQQGKEKTEPQKVTVSDNVQDDNNIIVKKDVALVEMTSTGQIPYEKFKTGFDEYALYDVYDMGEYRDYIDEGYFPYEHNDKVGYCDANGNVLISEQYVYGTFFFEGKAFVLSESGIWQIIDKTGKVLFDIPSEYSSSYTWDNIEKAYFFDGKAVFWSDNGIVIIDENMNCKKVAIPSSLRAYYKVIKTKEFSGVLIWDSLANKYDLYDLSGKTIWSSTVDNSCLNINKIKQGIFGYVDVHNSENPNFIIAKNGYINVFDENEKWGLMDLKTGQMVIPYKYDYVGVYSDGVVPVCSYDKWGCVDINDNVVINPSMKYLGEFTNNRAFAVTENSGFVVIDKNGNVIAEYENFDGQLKTVFSFSEKTGIAATERDIDGRHDVVTSTGKTLKTIISEKGICITDKYIFMGGKMYQVVQ